MTFPVEFNLAGHRVPAHGVLELAAYVVGVQLYFSSGARAAGGGGRIIGRSKFVADRWVRDGAMVGSKILAWVESPWDYWSHRDTPLVLLSGKTIVGGLLGGWIGVELVKKKFGVRRATGDLFVFPLVIGIAIGRVGCFLTGLRIIRMASIRRCRGEWILGMGRGIRRSFMRLGLCCSWGG
jgi:hypothetical protein